MLCPQCGKQMPPGAEECPYCGYEINVENLVRQSFPEGEDDDNSGISAHMAGIIIVRTYKRITHALITDFEFARLRMMIFIMVLVHNLNETSLCSLNHPYWLLFLFTAVSGPRDWAIEEGALKTEKSFDGSDHMREVKALG